MRPVTVTTSNASGGTVNSSPIVMDYNASVRFNAGFTTVVTGTATYTVQAGNDLTNWFNSPDATGASANAMGGYDFPFKYMRLQQTAGSGSVALTVIQTGPAR